MLYLSLFYPHFLELHRKSLLFIFHVFSWGFPLVTCFVVVWGGYLFHSPMMLICIPREPYQFIFWFFPLLIVMLITSFIYIRMIVKLNSQFSLVTRSTSFSQKYVNFRLTLYIAVFLFCWTPNFANYVVDYFKGCTYYPLLLTANFIMNIQGLLDCLVYSFSNSDVRKNYTKRKGLLIFVVSPLLVVPVFFRYIFYRIRGRCSPYDTHGYIINHHHNSSGSGSDSMEDRVRGNAAETERLLRA
eukprot:TRINITY_DN13292_c0_g1_i1.p1 TRINITY_DN13292_c0_g1~~TRINITY_DN13292_c0_g1_i1.p1  ORF type:complete len:243 (+),score=3.92 TRINITY_DN13292_c0_g1_i1:163-891(+)